ncbi:MAG: calcium-binding protein [Roseovarius sp.]
MIDVKGIRSNQANADPDDPLNLRAQEEVGNKKTVFGWFGGLLAVGLYLRSFLWSEPEASVPAEETPLPDAEDAVDAPHKVSLRLVGEEPAPEEEGSNDIEPELESTVASPIPGLPGPFAPFFFEPLSVLASGTELPRDAANAALPPFKWLGQANVGRMIDSPMGGYTPFSSVPNSNPSPIVSPEQTDETNGPDDDRDDEDTPQDPNKGPRNNGPVYLGDVGSGLAVSFALSYFLPQTYDPEGDLLSISMGSSTSGTMIPKGEGWLYLADTDFLGEVKINFVLTDGEFEVPQSAYLTVIENIFTGTDGDDLLVGTRGRDRIVGLEGDDNLAGLGGRDTIEGGGGDDNIAGGDGDDILIGGDGDDVIVGGRGDDWISGGAGNDRLYGGAGDDEIYGDAGDDEIHGDQGNDVLSGGDGDDRIWGGDDDDVLSGDAGDDLLMGDAGDDVISGGVGNDTAFGGQGDDLIFGDDGDDLLDGGDGNDILVGDEGRDVLIGGAGDDVLRGGSDEDTVMGGAGDDLVIADDDDASDHYDGGEGHDQLDYSDATQPVNFDLEAGTASGESTGEDSFENFERFVGTEGDDTFYACGGEAILTGNGGADLYTFAQGDTVDIIRSLYQITDFDSDDEMLIQMGSNHRHIRKAQDSLEDRLEDSLEDYAEGVGADEPRLSYHYDWTDTYRRTVIEVDFDRDKVVDLQVVLDGEHILVFETA